MAMRLVPLLATQVARVRFPRLKFAVAKAKVFTHLEAWVRVGCGIPHVKGHNSVLRICYSKE
jgi:hypothetical protein